MNKKHSKVLDEEKLAYAKELINALGHKGSPADMLQRALLIMQFGDISVQDMLDFLEATGG